jgi:hypothetical protein
MASFSCHFSIGSQILRLHHRDDPITGLLMVLSTAHCAISEGKPSLDVDFLVLQGGSRSKFLAWG